MKIEAVFTLFGKTGKCVGVISTPRIKRIKGTENFTAYIIWDIYYEAGDRIAGLAKTYYFPGKYPDEKEIRERIIKGIENYRIGRERPFTEVKLTDSMKKITVEELQLAFDRIIDKLRRENVESIEFNTDFYRLIPTGKWAIDKGEKDELHNIGSLFDGIESIQKLQDIDRICTYVDFDRVASILRAISQERNPV